MVGGVIVVVEVVEHEVHVLLRLRGQVGSIQVLIILIDCDTHAALCHVTGGSGSFWQTFCIMMKLLIRRIVLLKTFGTTAKTTRSTATMLYTLAGSFLVQVLEEGRRYATRGVHLLIKLMRVQLVVATDARHINLVLLVM